MIVKLALPIFALAFAAATQAQILPAPEQGHPTVMEYVFPNPAPAASISGHVTDPSGKPAPDAVVTLVPGDRETALITSVQRTAKTDANGNFEIDGLLPGSYLLLVKWRQDSKDYWYEHEIQTSGIDMAGLQLQLQGAMNLSGSIRATEGADFISQHLTVRLAPEDSNSSEETAEVAKDGTFSFADLRPTLYQLQLTGLADGWYLASAVQGGQDALNQGVNLSKVNGEQPLEIKVSPGASVVRGVVIDQIYLDRVPNAVVQLFPDPANPNRADLLRTVATNSDGSFTIENVVPGRYRALAIMGRRRSEAEVGEITAEDSRIARRAGVSLSVDRNHSKTLELQLFEAQR